MISLSERFIYEGYAREDVPLKSAEFTETVFANEAATKSIEHFKEFAHHNRPISESLKELPSLGYLFDPFDPGQPQSQAFVPEQTLTEKTYTFAELDLRDVNIINTLEKAEKKASDMLAEARKKAQDLTTIGQTKLSDLATEAKNKASAEAADLVKAAQAQADEILAKAQASVGDLDQMRQEVEKLRTEAAESLAELKQGQAKTQAAEKELAEMRAGLEADRKIAQQEAQKAKTAAFEQGRNEGLAQGRTQGESQGLAQGLAQGRQEALDRTKELLNALTKANNLWPELWNANGAFMVQLAVEAAEAIVNKEIKDGQGLAAGAFKACLDYLHQAHEVTFKIHPADLKELEEARAELRDQVDGLLNIKFQPDPALGPGDLIMEADVGRLDATIKNRREKVMTVLRAALDQGLIGQVPAPPKDPEPSAQIEGLTAVGPAGTPTGPLSGQGPITTPQVPLPTQSPASSTPPQVSQATQSPATPTPPQAPPTASGSGPEPIEE